MLLFFATLLLGATAPAVEVHALTGEKSTGAIIELADDRLSIESAGNRRELVLSELQRIVFTDNTPAEQPAGPRSWVELADGSQLVATRYNVAGKRAQIELVGGGQAELPIAAVRAVRFKQQDERQRGQWNEIRNLKLRSDLIVIRKKERADYLEGVLGDITDSAVAFKLDDEVIPVGRDKVEGVIYFSAGGPAPAPATFRVADIYGSTIAGVSRATTPAGVKVVSPSGLVIERSFEQIRQIDFSAGKIVFLSDLKPEVLEWKPFFGGGQLSGTLQQLYQPRMDQALKLAELSSADNKLKLMVTRDGTQDLVSYDKGIAIHSRSKVVFLLPEGVRLFRALVGIDARVRQHGNVQLVIRGDGRELFSGAVVGTSEPQELTLDVASVRRLELFVDYGENLDVGDHLNLCNARLIK